MRTLGRRGGVTAALCVLLGLAAAGCSKTGTGFDLSRLIQPPGPLPSAGPAPSSPVNALRLFEWCYNNKSLSAYRELFADDFQWFCSPIDSAGARYRGTPWTREDELIFATHLFGGGGADQPPAASIRLTLDKNFLVYPDPNHAQWDAAGRWHKSIRTQLLLSIRMSDGSAVEILGVATFYLVRGDSALIPEELRLRGFGPDSSRWYIRRWDETPQPEPAPARSRASGESGVASRPPLLAAQPTRATSWCQLKALYR